MYKVFQRLFLKKHGALYASAIRLVWTNPKWFLISAKFGGPLVNSVLGIFSLLAIIRPPLGQAKLTSWLMRSGFVFWNTLMLHLIVISPLTRNKEVSNDNSDNGWKFQTLGKRVSWYVGRKLCFYLGCALKYLVWFPIPFEMRSANLKKQCQAIGV